MLFRRGAIDDERQPVDPDAGEIEQRDPPRRRAISDNRPAISRAASRKAARSAEAMRARSPSPAKPVGPIDAGRSLGIPDAVGVRGMTVDGHAIGVACRQHPDGAPVSSVVVRRDHP